MFNVMQDMFEIIVQNSCSIDTLTRAHTALY